IDDAESVIWAPRYSEVGDFEIYAAADCNLLELLQPDRYVVRNDSAMVGIIERVKLEVDAEDGDHVTVSGRCAKSILSRRIVWGLGVFTGTVEDCIRKAIADNATAPSMAQRAIPGLLLGERLGLADTLDVQVTGKNLMDTIISWCKAYSYGWEVVLGADRKFLVRLFVGEDRSDAQSVNPRVTFSPAFDNLLASNYEYDVTDAVNAVLVAGEGEGINRKMVGVGSASGISRRENFVDARNASSKVGDAGLTPVEYAALLTEQGRAHIAENTVAATFDGEIDHATVFTLGEHYFLGDIVNVINEYGVAGTARITEIVECEDAEGHTVTPTFEEWRLV
ncbi:MAG: siphovirus ReqiPepy6 Gp37-like family protein, partial [Raoultibacter sp.]